MNFSHKKKNPDGRKGGGDYEISWDYEYSEIFHT